MVARTGSKGFEKSIVWVGGGGVCVPGRAHWSQASETVVSR